MGSHYGQRDEIQWLYDIFHAQKPEMITLTGRCAQFIGLDDRRDMADERAKYRLSEAAVEVFRNMQAVRDTTAPLLAMLLIAVHRLKHRADDIQSLLSRIAMPWRPGNPLSYADHTSMTDEQAADFVWSFIVDALDLDPLTPMPGDIHDDVVRLVQGGLMGDFDGRDAVDQTRAIPAVAQNIDSMTAKSIAQSYAEADGVFDWVLRVAGAYEHVDEKVERHARDLVQEMLDTIVDTLEKDVFRYRMEDRWEFDQIGRKARLTEGQARYLHVKALDGLHNVFRRQLRDSVFHDKLRRQFPQAPWMETDE